MKLKINKKINSDSSEQWEDPIEKEIREQKIKDVRLARRRAQIETMYNLYRKYYSIQLKLKNFDIWEDDILEKEIEKISTSICEGEKKLKEMAAKKPYIFLTIGLEDKIEYSSFKQRWEEILLKIKKYSKKVDIQPMYETNPYNGVENKVRFLYTIEQRSDTKTWDEEKEEGYFKGLHIHILMKTPDLKKSKIMKDYCLWWHKAIGVPKHMCDLVYCDDDHASKIRNYINYKKSSPEKMKKVEIDKILHESVLEGFSPYGDAIWWE